MYPSEAKWSGSLSWSDTENIWRNNEASLEHWQRYYQSQGYQTWEEWREKFFRRFGVRHLKWDSFEINYPIQVVPLLRGADFRGWRKLMAGKKHLTFWEMVQLEGVRNHKALEDFRRNFPKETTIIAIKHLEEIFVIEGMHRCAAHTLAFKEGIIIDSKIKLVIGTKNSLRPFFLGFRL